MELNIIWCLKTDNEIYFSKDWILEIFSLFDIKEHFDKSCNFDTFSENSLIVVSNVTEQKRFIDYLNKFNNYGKKYCVLHLSDEICDHDITFYSTARKVIRTLHNQKYQELFNTFTIPVGYKSGIKKTTNSKTYLLNFIGQIKSDRYQMLQIFQNVKDKYFFITNQWDDPNGLDTMDYSKILSQSIFTLCPRGWDGTPIETFRLNEALECDSIPISTLDNGFDYFSVVFGKDHPFIVGENWNDALNKMNEVKNYQDKISEVNKWWFDFKNRLKNQLLSFYQTEFNN